MNNTDVLKEEPSHRQGPEQHHQDERKAGSTHF